MGIIQENYFVYWRVMRTSCAIFRCVRMIWRCCCYCHKSTLWMVHPLSAVSCRLAASVQLALPPREHSFFPSERTRMRWIRMVDTGKGALRWTRYATNELKKNKKKNSLAVDENKSECWWRKFNREFRRWRVAVVAAAENSFTGSNCSRQLLQTLTAIIAFDFSRNRKKNGRWNKPVSAFAVGVKRLTRNWTVIQKRIYFIRDCIICKCIRHHCSARTIDIELKCISI